MGIHLGRYIGKGGLQPTSALQVAFSLASNKGASLSIHVLPPEPSELFLMAGSPLLQLNSETERLDRLTATTLEAAKKFFAQSGINKSTTDRGFRATRRPRAAGARPYP